MLSLYELETQYKDLLDQYADGEDFEAWNELLDELTGAIDVKVTNIALVVKHLQAEESAISEEIKSLQTKKSARSAKIDRLKAYMLEGMQAAGIEKTTDVRAEVRIQKNPPSVAVYQDKDIPSQYWIAQEPKLDKKAILERLKAGEDVPGTELRQTLGVRIK